MGTIIELINLGMEHQFTSDSLDISTEFLKHSLSSLTEMRESMQYHMVLIISLVGANKKLGKQVVIFLLQQFTDTGDRLREAMVYRYEDTYFKIRPKNCKIYGRFVEYFQHPTIWPCEASLYLYYWSKNVTSLRDHQIFLLEEIFCTPFGPKTPFCVVRPKIKINKLKEKS